MCVDVITITNSIIIYRVTITVTIVIVIEATVAGTTIAVATIMRKLADGKMLMAITTTTTHRYIV